MMAEPTIAKVAITNATILFFIVLDDWDDESVNDVKRECQHESKGNEHSDVFKCFHDEEKIAYAIELCNTFYHLFLRIFRAVFA